MLFEKWIKNVKQQLQLLTFCRKSNKNNGLWVSDSENKIQRGSPYLISDLFPDLLPFSQAFVPSEHTLWISNESGLGYHTGGHLLVNIWSCMYTISTIHDYCEWSSIINSQCFCDDCKTWDDIETNLQEDATLYLRWFQQRHDCELK